MSNDYTFSFKFILNHKTTQICLVLPACEFKFSELVSSDTVPFQTEKSTKYYTRA